MLPSNRPPNNFSLPSALPFRFETYVHSFEHSQGEAAIIPGSRAANEAGRPIGGLPAHSPITPSYFFAFA